MLDLLILGAGVSGLTLASRLRDRGLDLAVFEARGRVGGRTGSRTVDGHRFDVGASWVWDHERAVHAALQTLHIPTFAAHEDGLDLFESDLETMVQSGRLPRAWSPARRVVGGTQAIAQALADGLGAVPLTLGRAAVRIERCDSHLQVTFDDGSTVLARSVAAAYPPPLVAGQLDPAEPGRAALAETPIWMADVAKAVAVFDEPFWRGQGRSGRALSHVGPMVEIHDLSGPTDTDGAALFGFIPRAMPLPSGGTADGADETAIAEAVVAQLGRLFGPPGAAPSAVVIVPWWRERFTAPPDGPPSREALFGHADLRTPLLDGRLHLISTETASLNTGHIDGAISRALEVANALTDGNAT